MTGKRANRQAGFTALEMMIIVMVIGLLVSLATPSFLKARQTAKQVRFISDLRVATHAFEQHAIIKGVYPPDRTPGVMPPGMEEYLANLNWSEETTIGGQWDWDYNRFGVVAGVSVYKPSVSETELRKIDQKLDDGNLSTGIFRARTDGYIYVIEE